MVSAASLHVRCAAVIMVYTGESINRLGAQHWRSFATQDYFDSSGLFYTVMVSVPLLFVAIFVLCSILWETVQLMIVYGREKARRSAVRVRVDGAGATEAAPAAGETKKDQ
eukprot:c12084_g1_i1.p2 GENE.c12084_g1_i1~~c12084_g1_i1.p2  ORF type:complete len:111 (+),score=13.65 c12084_g1_i1:323-655(+)